MRLYEEAAWLYMQVGDNMLAIYASEKALRLAERLGEVRAASRAHGIFGRVFGRIGDTAEGAREPRARGRARADSDEDETVLALLALGHHLEHAEGDYAAAERATARRWRSRSGSATCPRRSSCTRRSPSSPSTAATGRGWRAPATRAPSSPNARGSSASCACPYALRGLLHWRDGDWEASSQLFRSARELAEQVGWSEVSFNALLGLAVTQRDRGDLADAETTLTQALSVCERAGLIGQSIQATAMRAVILALAGDDDLAAEAADQAATLAERVHYPLGEAAVLEARGMTSELPEALELLAQGRAAWTQLGRPLDSARCELLLGQRAQQADPGAGGEALAAAAAAYERLGVGHLARRARELMAV